MMITQEILNIILSLKKQTTRDFPVGVVVKNPPANARDMGSIPGPGRSHILQST